MGITGNLRTMQLAELLQWLSQGKKTGTLVVEATPVEKRVVFKDGRIIASASTDPKEYLGHFLVSHGFISELELSKAIEMQERTGMLLGKILVTIGAIGEEDLYRLLRLKAEESIFDLFTWPEAEFRFLDDDLPERTMVLLDLDVTGIVLEGVRRLDEWQRIRAVIPTTAAIPVGVVEPLDDPRLSQGERLILQQIDDQRTVEEISLQTHSSEFHVCRVLFDQVEKRRIKVIKPRWASEGEPRAISPSAPRVEAGALVHGALRHLEDKSYEQALRHLRAAKSLEPDNKQVQTTVEEGEQKLREALDSEGVSLTSVPVLAAHLEELTASKISPQEGFMLTRINGSYDIQSILKISPIPQLDALLVFWRLLRQGHIKLENKAKKT